MTVIHVAVRELLIVAPDLETVIVKREEEDLVLESAPNLGIVTETAVVTAQSLENVIERETRIGMRRKIVVTKIKSVTGKGAVLNLVRRRRKRSLGVTVNEIKKLRRRGKAVLRKKIVTERQVLRIN